MRALQCINQVSLFSRLRRQITQCVHGRYQTISLLFIGVTDTTRPLNFIKSIPYLTTRFCLRKSTQQRIETLTSCQSACGSSIQIWLTRLQYISGVIVQLLAPSHQCEILSCSQIAASTRVDDQALLTTHGRNGFFHSIPYRRFRAIRLWIASSLQLLQKQMETRYLVLQSGNLMERHGLSLLSDSISQAATIRKGVTDLNVDYGEKILVTTAAPANFPSGISGNSCTVIQHNPGSPYSGQIAFGFASATIAIRFRNNSKTWGNWKYIKPTSQIFHITDCSRGIQCA